MSKAEPVMAPLRDRLVACAIWNKRAAAAAELDGDLRAARRLERQADDVARAWAGGRVMATSTQAVSLSNIGPGNTSPFSLKGGKFGFSASATWGGGNVQLQALAGDGATWINVGSALVVATPYQVFDLPPGQYRLNVTTASAVYTTIDGIPT